MISVRVLFFGPARDAAGVEAIEMELPDGATVAGLTDQLCRDHPGLAAGRAAVRLAVNRQFAGPGRVLVQGDEVAVIPPVSGGQVGPVWVALTAEPIDVARVRAAVSGEAALGGIVIFEGTTRAETHAEHGALVQLEYESCGEMALEQMRRLACEVRQRQPAARIAMVHRLGIVRPGEASVVIAVACPHRTEAFEDCRWLIDQLKTEVPIWKREVWSDGETTWVEPENKKSKSRKV